MEQHDLDPISLIFGIVFLGFASTGLFRDVDFTPIQARWVWPVLLIVAGALVLMSTTKRPERAAVVEDPYSLRDDTDEPAGT